MSKSINENGFSCRVSHITLPFLLLLEQDKIESTKRFDYSVAPVDNYKYFKAVGISRKEMAGGLFSLMFDVEQSFILFDKPKVSEYIFDEECLKSIKK